MKKQLTQNFRPGRNGHQIKAIVLHKCEGGGTGCLSWVCNPTAQVSYHFIILESGEMVQCVEIENTAWHAGKVSNPTAAVIHPQINPNLYTIGVSLAGTSDIRHTKNQMLALIGLLDYLKVKTGLELSEDTLIFHSEITDYKKDPGRFINKTNILAMVNLLNS